MRRVTFCYFAMHGTRLQHVAAPPVLEDESPALCTKFHAALLASPQGFRYAVELEGFPVVNLEWVPVCYTAGALLLPSFVSRPGHDLAVILLNGLETPDELGSLTQRFPLRAEIWQHVMAIEKPVAIGALYTVGRLREPATVTIINAFANSFFSLFGTNEIEEQVRRSGK